MGIDTSSNDIMKMLADRKEAANAQSERIEQLPKNDKSTYMSAVEAVASRLKTVITIEPGSPAIELYETLFFYHEYVPYDLSENKVSCLIKKAKTDYNAYLSLKLFSHLIGDNGKQFAALTEWRNQQFAGVSRPPRRPRAMSKFKNVHRDTLIVAEIKSLVGIGFKATREKSKPGHSACDVIADALDSLGKTLSYAAIESIWGRREILPKPTFLAEALAQSSLKPPLT